MDGPVPRKIKVYNVSYEFGRATWGSGELEGKERSKSDVYCIHV